MTERDPDPASNAGPEAAQRRAAARVRASAGPLRWVLAALLAAVALALYAPALEGEYLYDDLFLVEEAPAAQSVGDAFARFGEPTFRFGVEQGLEVRGVWRPLMSIALGAGNSLGGGEPFAHHAISLLLHVLCAAALARFVALLLRTRLGLGAGRAEVVAAAAGLLFVVHPASVEAVAWASAVNDPLWTLFGLGALTAYERARVLGKLPVTALVLTALALLSKESAIVLPALFLVLDLSAGRLRGPGGFARAGLVAAAPLAAWYGARAWVFGSATAGLLDVAGDFNLPGIGRELSFRLELAGGFVRNALWPGDPRFFRPVHPEPLAGAVSAGAAWITAFVGATALLAWRGRRSAAACLAAFFLVVLPFVVAPDRAGLYPLSDRYLYGALGPLAAGLALLGARVASGNVFAVLAVSAAVPMFAVARGEIPHFSSNTAFQDQAVEDAPDSPSVRWAAGNAHLERYLATEDIGSLRAAYVHHLISLRLGQTYGDEDYLHDESVPFVERIPRLVASIDGADPLALEADSTVLVTIEDRYQATLGQIHCELLRVSLVPAGERDYVTVLGRIEQAQRVWSRTAGYARRDELSHLRAQVLQRLGRAGEARAEIGRALESGGGATSLEFVELAKVQLQEGDPEAARSSLERAAELDPDDATLQLRLSILADATGRSDVALEAAQRAYELTGGQDANVLVHLSVLDLARGRSSEALSWVDRALELDPGLGNAFKQRALTYTLLGDADRALSDWQSAARALPEDFVSHYNLAALLLEQEPPESSSAEVREGWRQSFVEIAVRAYVYAPPQGSEQLQLQTQIERYIGGNPDEIYDLTSILRSQGRGVLAQYWMRRLIDVAGVWPEPKRRALLPLVHTQVGYADGQAGRPDDARAEFEAALALDPEHFPAIIELGMLLYEAGEAAEAVPYLEKALQKLPEAGVEPGMLGAVETTLRERLRAARAGAVPERSSGEDPDGG
ncbi:MAG: tetratricopeptide repeat protein [Planctomycetota bacterium]